MSRVVEILQSRLALQTGSAVQNSRNFHLKERHRFIDGLFNLSKLGKFPVILSLWRIELVEQWLASFRLYSVVENYNRIAHRKRQPFRGKCIYFRGFYPLFTLCSSSCFPQCFLQMLVSKPRKILEACWKHPA